MKRTIAALFAALLVFTPVRAADWTLIAEIVSKSVVFVENTASKCTGFVINSDADKERKRDIDYILTAAHCDGKELYADQTTTRIIAKDERGDYLVLEVSDTERPALKLAKNNPKRGEEVMSFGYGYALERPVLRIAHVSDDDYDIPYEGIGGPFIVTDASFIPGMSGGPVVNAKGEVVMIIQMGTAYMGIGRGAEHIKSKVGKYFEKPTPAVK